MALKCIHSRQPSDPLLIEFDRFGAVLRLCQDGFEFRPAGQNAAPDRVVIGALGRTAHHDPTVKQILPKCRADRISSKAAQPQRLRELRDQGVHQRGLARRGVDNQRRLVEDARPRPPQTALGGA